MKIVYRSTADLVDEKKLAAAVRKVEKSFRPDVVRIKYKLGEDWAGDPAIFFNTLLSDQAAEEPRLYEVGDAVRARITAAVDAYSRYVNPFFFFRGASEQAGLRDPDWD